MHFSTGAARLRMLLARRPWIYWAAVILLGSVIALNVRGAVADLDRQRGEWGATTEVWVITMPADAGGTVQAARRHYPRAVVPPSRVRSDPSGTVARRGLDVGQIVVDADVRAAGAAGMIEAGHVAVPIGGSHPFVAVGDAVRVVGNGVDCAGLVVAVSDAAVLVSVDRTMAAAVATAASAIGVVVALTGPAG